MEQERIAKALARIEAAAARIEAAAGSSPAPAAPAPTMPAPRPQSDLFAPVDSDLARRHEALRREAWAALAELDTLIEAIEA